MTRKQLRTLLKRFVCFLPVLSLWYLAPTLAQENGFASVQYIGQTIPRQMEVGGSYTVKIQVQNVGTSAWTDEAGVALVLQSPGNNESWGISQVALGSEEQVRPGELKVFEFQVVAPQKPNTYHFSWALVSNGKPLEGTIAPATPIIVADPFARAAFVSQLLPDRVEPGERFKVIIQYQNAGKASWSQQHGYKLAALSGDAAKTWGTNTIDLKPNRHVLPKGTVTFAFQLRAPAQPGVYDFQWQMYHEDKHWFGEPTPKLAISVGQPEPAPVALDLRSEFISQLVPDTMSVEQNYTVTVMFKNTGTANWRAGEVTLVAQSPHENLNWFISQVELAPGDVVEPGGIKIFRFDVRAPSDPGNYPFQWRLSHRRTGVFGDLTEDKAIPVSALR